MVKITPFSAIMNLRFIQKIQRENSDLIRAPLSQYRN